MTDDRPRCYIRHAVIADGWVAYFLGTAAVRSALRDVLDDLPAGPAREAVLDLLSACRLAGKAWAAEVRASQTETRESAIGVQSNHGELTTTCAADMLGISPRRVRQLAANGELPARRVGARWRFSADEIQKRR
jgi:excisionase family DNA binding protein